MSLALLAPHAVDAQSASSAIQGLIRDSTGAVVVGAQVSATNTATGVQYAVESNDRGFFRIGPIERGPYVVTCVAPGFAEATVEGIQVAANDVREVDVTLQIAGVTSEVSVTAEAPITDLATSDLSARINSRTMRDLPLNGRDFTRLALFTPGVVAYYSNLSSLSFNGLSSETSNNNFLLDGTDATNVENNRPSAAGERGPRLQTGSIEGLEEFKIVSGTYSAEYGRAAGGVVQITSKSGTNSFTGSLFEFFRDERFDARNFFDSSRLPFDLNQFGGTLGGPIIRNRAFFFVNYEGSRQGIGLTGVGTVPTRAALTGLHPALQGLADTFPEPSEVLNATTGMARLSGTLDTKEDVFAIKVDHNVTMNDRLFARYSYNRAHVGGPAFALFNNYLGTDQIQDSTFVSQFVSVGYTRVFGSSVVNELRVGLNLKDYESNNGGSGLYPQVRIGGYQIIAGQLSTADTSSQSIDIAERVQWVKGRHAMRFGFDVRRPESTNRNNGFYSVFYPNLTAFINNAASSATILPNQEDRTFSNWNTGFFFQDDWRATDKLTLNLGLRYDYNTVLEEAEGFATNYVGGTGPNLVGGDFTGVGDRLYNPDKNNLAPRVGFAYDLFGSGRTVVRGGVGLFYALTTISTSQTALSNPPGPGVYILSASPSLPLGIPLPDPTVGVAPPRRPVAIDPELSDGFTRQYSVNVQQQLGDTMMVQVGYMGYQGRDLLRYRNINEFPQGIFVRPDPRWSGLLLYESEGKANYNSLQVSANRRHVAGLSYGAAYTLAHLKDDIPNNSSPQNPLDMAAEYADGDNDVRHNLNAYVSYELPFDRWFGPGRLTEGWQVNGLLFFRSGMPIDVKLGYDSYGNNSFNERPDLVGDPAGDPSGNRGFINPAAYKEPAPGSYGNAPRNSARGPSFRQVDFSLTKTTRLRGSQQLQFRWEVFNVLNTTNFASQFFLGSTLTSGQPGTLNPGFGTSTQTFGRTVGLGTARQMQFAVKYTF